jgi:hypothetical protein
VAFFIQPTFILCPSCVSVNRGLNQRGINKKMMFPYKTVIINWCDLPKRSIIFIHVILCNSYFWGYGALPVIFGSRPDHRYTWYTLQLAELITKLLEFERNVYWRMGWRL